MTAMPDDIPNAPARGRVSRFAVSVLTAPVIAYRRWISPNIPARCRFYPSCSAYGLEALHVHGPLRGFVLMVWRILRCQPFHPGGYDPVPPPRDRPSARNKQNKPSRQDRAMTAPSVRLSTDGRSNHLLSGVSR